MDHRCGTSQICIQRRAYIIGRLSRFSFGEIWRATNERPTSNVPAGSTRLGGRFPVPIWRQLPRSRLRDNSRLACPKTTDAIHRISPAFSDKLRHPNRHWKVVQVRHRKMRVAPDLDGEAGMNRIGGQFRSSPISQAADRALGFGYLENRESAHHGLVKCFGIRFGINEVAPEASGKFGGGL